VIRSDPFTLIKLGILLACIVAAWIANR